MATLIIRLRGDQKNTALYFNDAGTLERSEPFKQFNEIKQAQASLIILLPGEDVHMTQAVLPNMSAAELQQAAPNILEEQLAEDISELYFAIGDADENNQRHIAIIRKSIWDTLINQLKDNGLTPTLIIPDYFALPIADDSWTIFCENEHSLLRFSKQQGCACDTALLQTLVDLNLNEADQAPDSVMLIHEKAASVPQLDCVSSHNTRLQSFGELLAPNALLLDPPFNMLARQFRKKRRNSERSYWHYCGLSFAILIAVFFLGQLALYANFKIKSSRLDHQLLSTYQKIFPNATQLIEPKFRVEQQIKEYELAPNPFMRILARIGQVKKQNNAIDITSLAYADNKITFIAVANNNSDLNQFNKQLANAGLKITSNQTNTLDKQITETLSVELL